MARVADCHPEREHCAKGLCRTCWERQRVRDPKKRAAYNKKYVQAHKDEIREQQRTYRAKNKTRHRRVARLAQVRRDFGLSAEQYQALVRAHGGRCGICKGVNKSGIALHVDHCHGTGAVRGLLCTSCNMAVGWAERRGVEAIDALRAYVDAALAKKLEVA